MIIGYEGYSPGNTGIADRRRVLFWASNRGHTIVGSRDSRAEIIVITSSSNLGFWEKSRTSTPIILDVVDGLIGEQSLTKDFLRGYAYWATGKSTSSFPKNYRKLLLSVARKSKLVVCSSPEQVREWAKYRIQAVDILDIHDEVRELPKLSSEGPLRFNELFWEGLPSTLRSVSLLGGFFESSREKNFRLNVLTNLNSYKYMNKYRKVDLDQLISKQLSNKNLEINLVQWSPSALETYSDTSSVGVIPIESFQGYNHLKAENRLLIMWRLGLPVLTSPLESYVRTMRQAGIDGICKDKYEWNTKLKNLFNSKDLREEIKEKAMKYLINKHDTENLLMKWDSVITE